MVFGLLDGGEDDKPNGVGLVEISHGVATQGSSSLKRYQLTKCSVISFCFCIVGNSDRGEDGEPAGSKLHGDLV